MNKASRFAVRSLERSALMMALVVVAGCTTPGRRLEIHWYTPLPEVTADTESSDGGSWVRVGHSRHRLPPLSSPTVGVRSGDYTVHTLPPGKYEFEYMLPDSQEVLYGELDVYSPRDRAVKEFIRRTFITISPGAPGGEPGFATILSAEDLDRVRGGDMVTKLVFVADLKAVDRRLDMIEEELRHIRDLEARLTGQLAYWNAKLSDRRRNAFYFDEYGMDIPSGGLAALQTLVGAETYHWVRYTEAEDKVRSYEEEIARLALPAERLREERAALRGVLASAQMIYRQNEMMLATYRMQRPYFDAWDEINKERDAIYGPKGTHENPYHLSSVTKSLGYPVSLPNKTKMKKKEKEIGETILVMRLGAREPVGR